MASRSPSTTACSSRAPRSTAPCSTSATRAVIRAGRVRVLMRAALHRLAACGDEHDAAPDAPPALPACVPNRDGVITAAELPIALGATVTYYARHEAHRGPRAHERLCDFVEESPDDTVVALGPVALAAQWYAANSRRPVRRRRRQRPRRHLPPGRRALWLDGTASQEDGRRQDADPLRRSDRIAPVPAGRRRDVGDDRPAARRDDRRPAVHRHRRVHDGEVTGRDHLRHPVPRLLAGPARAHEGRAHGDRQRGSR